MSAQIPRDRPAANDDVVVSREMISAGLSALCGGEHAMCPVCEVSAATLMAVYTAMERLKGL
jgi:hypothetical protein